MSSVLITGASGFIGSHLCDRFLKLGWKVRAQVRRSSDLRWLEGKPVELCAGDITEPDSLAGMIQDTEVIVHNAGLVKARRRADMYAANRDGVRNLVAAAAKHGERLRKLVLVSTLSAAGPGDANEPVSDYGRSKLAGEQVLAREGAGLPSAILRLPGVYGPRDREAFIIFRLARGPIAPVPGLKVSACYVADAVEAVCRLAVLEGTQTRPFSVCDGQVYTYAELVQRVAGLLGHRVHTVTVPGWLLRPVGWFQEAFSRELPIVNRDKVRELSCRDWTCGYHELRAATGFEPKYDIETGLHLSFEWYRQHGWI